MAEKLQIIIDADDHATGAIKGVNSSLGSLGATAGKIAVGGLMAGTAAVVGLGAALGKMAFDAMPLEGIQNAFRGITKDADATMMALRKGSQGMVKDAELMGLYNNAFQLVGENFAEQLPDAMGYLTKVSAATGQDMGYLLDSLTKGVGRLSPMILDNLAIQVNAAEANEVYAASVGKAADELSKSEQQTALMNQVMQKLAENTKDMPDITDNASTKWAQFNTALANVKDNIGLAVLPILTPLMSKMAEIATDLAPKISAAFFTLSETLQKEGLGGAFALIHTEMVKAWDNNIVPELERMSRDFWAWMEDPERQQKSEEAAYDVGIKVTDAFKDALGTGTPKAVNEGFWDHAARTAQEGLSTKLSPIVEPIASGWLKAMIDGFEVNKAQWVKDLRGWFQGVYDSDIAGWFSGLIGSFGGYPGYASGGIIPGPMGAPTPIIAHGGELILNPQQQQQLMFNLTVNSRAESSSVIQDFNMLRSMAGV